MTFSRPFGERDYHELHDPHPPEARGVLSSLVGSRGRTGVPSMQLLVFILALLASLSAQSQTVGSCAPSDIGSPSCPYQWVGVTSVDFTGSGNGLGYVGMTTQCRADFGPGARMCTSSEIVNSDTLSLNAIPALGCWVRPAMKFAIGNSIIDESGESYSSVNSTCVSWKSFSSGNTGLVLLPSGTFSSSQTQPVPSPEQCNVAKPVACCRPQPVGEPQASMMLPAGVGALAMLSMLRGEA